MNNDNYFKQFHYSIAQFLSREVQHNSAVKEKQYLRM